MDLKKHLIIFLNIQFYQHNKFYIYNYIRKKMKTLLNMMSLPSNIPLETYQHLITHPKLTVSVELTPEQQAAILFAYDRGVDNMDKATYQHLQTIIYQLKDAIHL
ncbi:hypothetical protein [Neisseria zalophi]|uniref:Uncharacterized protein n=1 Tax=Neisseria zalophi TaxID=640030 RepID=A0A5J6PTV7_9NEIS|nr:hypothetical protein [Neisseria zalophi]QEY25796.1 hypothetical protein D0T92_04075 [Neisseria zalophi]